MQKNSGGIRRSGTGGYAVKYIILFIAAAVVTVAVVRLQTVFTESHAESRVYAVGDLNVKLPEPAYDSMFSVEKALSVRRSAREYEKRPLTLREVSQLLWSAQGVNAEWGGRTAPSAGATYPLEVYVAVGNVEGLKQGVYHYLPHNHSLERVFEGDVMRELAAASLNQAWVGEAAVDMVFAADYGRTTRVYGERGRRYVHMEAGHAAQNVYLQCVSLGCGTVVVGAFSDEAVKEVLKIPEGQEPLYIMPVGRTV